MKLTSYSYPITNAIEIAGKVALVDVKTWSEPQKRGIWNRTNEYWKARARQALVEWGTKSKDGKRDSEVTAKIKTVQGVSISCRPLELRGSAPCSLPMRPTQVIIFTIAAEAMATKNGKTHDYVSGPLSTRLQMSERLVRASVSSSFGDTASVFATGNAIHIRHFLAPPISMLTGSHQFSVPRNDYDAFWPDESIRPISDCIQVRVCRQTLIPRLT